ncbi:FHA domain-containing protein [Acaryochloris marina]|uniref:FHA domain-containing protein n=1 Tax=Acaryochloris marina TaxID=155978 RepID=UPI001BAE7668|nr:FHA domain-containing protein [Acaryochloris marina]QUY43614.1 FHA domain-containing protein [Acaryochloris marina S15]
MSTIPGQVRLNWQDPVTGEQRTPLLTCPIAFGREFAQMPAELNHQRVARIVLNSSQVSRYHTVIEWVQGHIRVTDQNSSNGTWVNGVLQPSCNVSNGDLLKIGPYEITLMFTLDGTGLPTAEASEQSIIQVPEPDSPVPAAPVAAAPVNVLPPAFQANQVVVQDLYATQLPVEEIDYLAVGAGLGSFIWVNFLRISGAAPQQIRALGIEERPYARYQRLCLNSQIPPHERLRSNSDSCPDNIWGWPGYALREAWHEFNKGKLNPALQYLWQVFAEPTFIQTYTPRAGNVFASIDREAVRIGWPQMYRFGRVRAIRKTNDGRYAIAYSPGRKQTAFVVARHVHLATGYPVLQFLPDLKAYREQTRDFKSVVNAYEDHNHVYETLERQGGTVVLRGRGIVASRIIQRLHEARQRNANISILHLMRSPKPKGNRFRKAQRSVDNHFEFQPFNWPKACWGGTLREELEQATPDQRTNFLADWGGTTTADRQDWKDLVQTGLDQGWYQITFGEVTRVVPNAQSRPTTYIQEKGPRGEIQLEADFIIDATGLDSKVKASPLLNDLVTHYNLPLNPAGRLAVTNDFELLEMRNQNGRMYGAGAITFGGPYAAVDSFLGLQYTALQALDGLVAARAPNLRRLNGISSFLQWLKWAQNKTP